MVVKEDKQRLKKLLLDAIRMLCKNGLAVQSAFRIEATIGITLNEDEVVLVSFKEVVQPDGTAIPQMWSDDESEDTNNVEVMKSEKPKIQNSVTTIDDDDNQEYADQNQQVDYSENSFEYKTDQKTIVSANTSASTRNRRAAHQPNYSQFPNSGNFRRSTDDDNSQFLPNVENSQFGSSSTHTGRTGTRGLNYRYDSHIQIKEENIPEMEGGDGFELVKVEDDDDNYDDFTGEQDESWGYDQPDDDSYTTAQNTRPVKRKLAGTSWGARSGPTNRQRKRPSGVGSSGLGALQNQSFAAGSGQKQDGYHGYSSMLQDMCNGIVMQSSVTGVHECHICHARLGSMQTLRTHIKKKHLALKLERCTICGETFRWASQVERHKKQHTENV